jgi:hypothetical protein
MHNLKKESSISKVLFGEEQSAKFEQLVHLHPGPQNPSFVSDLNFRHVQRLVLHPVLHAHPFVYQSTVCSNF